MSYKVLRSRWFNIIVLNVHESSEEKCDDSKDSFYEELEQVFFKYHVKILVEDSNAKLGRGIYSNRQPGMRVCIRIVKILVLE